MRLAGVTMSKILDLAKKLKRLSEQGIGGEAINAADQLEKICRKHDISLADLDDDEKMTAWFIVRPEQSRLFYQLVASVVGREWNTYGRKVNGRSKKNELGIEATRSELAEIEMKFSFYWKLYEDELDIFFSAFVDKNDLYVNAEPSQKDLSPEELERLRRVLLMAKNIKADSFRTQLKSHNG